MTLMATAQQLYSTLDDVLQSKTASALKMPLKVKIVALAPQAQQGPGPLKFSIADNENVAKAFCHSEELRNKIVAGKSVILTNYTVFNQSIILKQPSRVGLTKKMNVPDEIEVKARELVIIRTEPTSPIKDVLKASDRQLFSVQGTIMEAEAETTTEIFNQEVPLRNLTIKDRTGKLRCTLWRNFSTTELKVGHTIKLENVSTSTYNHTRVVNTNSKSSVEISPPIEVTQTVTLLGVDEEDNTTIHMLCYFSDDSTVLKMNKKDVFSATEVTKSDDLLEIMPLQVLVTTVGLDVTKVVKV